MVLDHKHHILYVFGGTNYKEYFGTLFAFDLLTGEWSKPSTFNQEKKPEKLARHSMIYDLRTEVILLFGGIGKDQVENEMCQLDTKSMIWDKPVIHS